MSETIRIAKWDVPKSLYDEYVKARILADAYAIGSSKDITERRIPMSEYERAMRWKLCVEHSMELHREICRVVGVEYSENPDDEFYKAFMDQTGKDTELKG